MVSHYSLWHWAHRAAVLFAALLFTAGFLCVLLWTNNIVRTPTSVASVDSSTFTYYSPPVSTFSITYNVAIFGTAWNSLAFIALIVLGRNSLPISTDRLRYDIEKAACIISAIGNALYAAACIAVMATLVRLAAKPVASPTSGLASDAIDKVASAGMDRQAGQASTAAMAGLAALSALCCCLLDYLHPQYSQHRHSLKYEAMRQEREPGQNS